MNADLTPFDYSGQEVRVVTVDGEPWFVAADVARILGYRMASDMTRRIDSEDRGTRSVRTPSGDQEMTVISEPGLYVAILGSQVSSASDFKRWLVRDVLPQIRRTGSYGVARELTPDEIVHQALQITAARVEELAARVAELEPPAQRWETFAEADGTYDMNQATKILFPDGGSGRQRFMARLRGDGVLNRDNTPRQEHVTAGRFVVKVSHWTRPDGVEQVSRSTRVTAKGIDWLASRYGGAA